MPASPTFAMVRPMRVGLTWDETDALAAGTLAGTEDAVRAANGGRASREHVDVYDRARALGWQQGEPVLAGPWRNQGRDFFVGFDDGTWRVRGTGHRRYEDEHALAMGIALAGLHCRVLREASPGAWVFASHSVDDPDELAALHEATRFAEALIVPEGMLRAALARFPREPVMVATCLHAPVAAIERRMRRLGIDIGWEPTTPTPAWAAAREGSLASEGFR